MYVHRGWRGAPPLRTLHGDTARRRDGSDPPSMRPSLGRSPAGARAPGGPRRPTAHGHPRPSTRWRGSFAAAPALRVTATADRAGNSCGPAEAGPPYKRAQHWSRRAQRGRAAPLSRRKPTRHHHRPHVGQALTGQRSDHRDWPGSNHTASRRRWYPSLPANPSFQERPHCFVAVRASRASAGQRHGCSLRHRAQQVLNVPHRRAEPPRSARSAPPPPCSAQT